MGGTRLAVILILLFAALGSTLMGRSVDEIEAIPSCEGGIDRAPEAVPLGLPKFGDPPVCKAKPTVSLSGPVDMQRPPQEGEGAITHQGYHFMGASTRFGVQGLYGSVCVTDPGVRRGLFDFVAAWYMVDTLSPPRWTQVGWAKVGWRDDRQYIFVYDTEHNRWEFFDQYPISNGMCVWVAVTASQGTSWDNWLWWNGEWNLLHTTNVGFSVPDRGDEYVEVYSADGFHPPLAPTQLSLSNVYTTDWFLWTTGIDSYDQNTGAPNYDLNWNNQWYDFWVSSR